MKKILAVDDLKSILMTLEAILVKEGFYVATCTNSMDAFDKLNSEHFDLVITDAIMPGGASGYSLISTVRSAAERFRDIPIIMLTGKREKADIEKALSAGANDYIIKPLDPDILVTKVKALIETSQKRTDFVEASVSSPAQVNTKTDIIAISEIEIKLSTNYQLTVGQLYRVSSDFLQEFEIPFINLRISECTKLNDTHSYQITGQIVGLADKELSKIRLWIRKKLSGI